MVQSAGKRGVDRSSTTVEESPPRMTSEISRSRTVSIARRAASASALRGLQGERILLAIQMILFEGFRTITAIEELSIRIAASNRTL